MLVAVHGIFMVLQACVDDLPFDSLQSVEKHQLQIGTLLENRLPEFLHFVHLFAFQFQRPLQFDDFILRRSMLDRGVLEQFRAFGIEFSDELGEGGFQGLDFLF